MFSDPLNHICQSFLEHAEFMEEVNEDYPVYHINSDLFVVYLHTEVGDDNMSIASTEHRVYFALLIAAERGEI